MTSIEDDVAIRWRRFTMMAGNNTIGLRSRPLLWAYDGYDGSYYLLNDGVEVSELRGFCVVGEASVLRRRLLYSMLVVCEGDD
jgi:hypothetical protein